MLPHESGGRRERESGSRRGAILACRSSESVESTSTRRKSPLFAERRRKRVSTGVCNAKESPAPSSRHPGDPGAREQRRGGELASVRVLRSRALDPRLTRLRSRGVAPHAAGYLGGAARRGPRSPSRTRIGRPLGVLAHRKRCKSRQAAPGSEKRGIDPFLTEHRFPRTGPSAHARAETSQDVTASKCGRRSAERRVVMAKSRDRQKTGSVSRGSETIARAA
jgi:hypothetical protein